MAFYTAPNLSLGQKKTSSFWWVVAMNQIVSSHHHHPHPAQTAKLWEIICLDEGINVLVRDTKELAVSAM